MENFIKKLILIILLIPSICGAQSMHPEKWYQDKYCAGEKEVVLPDKTRCDCVTDTHAIEYDFGRKWTEAIGQALYYSIQTGKRAGIVLIVETPEDRKYWIRLNSTIDHFDLPIDTWMIP